MKELITDEYKKIQQQLHKEKKEYGTASKKYINFVMQLAHDFKTNDILDYGCGKGTLQQNLPFKIQQYDPAILVHSQLPEPANIVICGDVLEHIEPECLDNVLEHIASLTKIAAFFVICGIEAKKHLSDGRNAHLIVEKGDWWFQKLSKYFTINSYIRNFAENEEEYIILANPREGDTNEGLQKD